MCILVAWPVPAQPFTREATYKLPSVAPASAAQAMHVSPLQDMRSTWLLHGSDPGESLSLGVSCDHPGIPHYSLLYYTTLYHSTALVLYDSTTLLHYNTSTLPFYHSTTPPLVYFTTLLLHYITILLHLVFDLEPSRHPRHTRRLLPLNKQAAPSKPTTCPHPAPELGPH